MLHYMGTSSAIILAVTALGTSHLGWLWVALLVGYAPAWIGHAFIEHNRPATFQYPLWSLLADFKMLAQAVRTREI